VLPEDYEGTHDRPDCELVPGGGRPADAAHAELGSLVHCNVRLKNINRLLHFMDAAVRRWAAAAGDYSVLPAGALPL
jgi:hypothetical protein